MNYYSTIPSPVGELMLVADDDALLGLHFVNGDDLPAESKQWKRDPTQRVIRQAQQELEEYFSGRRKAFSVAFRLSGTRFQEGIWNQIARIPYGKTASYTDLATHMKSPQATRAAGTATGRNPIAIIIPCHRVLGKSGGLYGFAGGLDRKRKLLTLESIPWSDSSSHTPLLL